MANTIPSYPYWETEMDFNIHHRYIEGICTKCEKIKCPLSFRKRNIQTCSAYNPKIEYKEFRNGEVKYIWTNMIKIKECENKEMVKIKTEKEIMEEKIKKVKNLIEETKKERRTLIENSHLEDVLKDKVTWTCENYRWWISKEFIKYLEKETDNTLLSSIKYMKHLKYKTYYGGFKNTIKRLQKLPKKEWENIRAMLRIIERYYPKYILKLEQEKLCHYTDCYKKLSDEKKCPQCESINEIEAVYCNQCGHPL